MRIHILIALVLLLAFPALKAQPVERRLIPSDDTYTYSNTTIRGMEDVLRTYHSTAGSQYRRITFLKFDISGLSPFISSAKLRLYASGFSAGGDNPHQFDLYPVRINTWSEDDITFANFVEKAGPDVTSPLLATYSVAAGQALAPGYLEFSDANLTSYIKDSLAAGKKYISIRMRERYVVKNGTAGVIVEFHSKENASGNSPELVVQEQDVEALKASAIFVNGQLIDGFQESVYRYEVPLPWDASQLPVVSATAKDPLATAEVIQATALTGAENERTARVTIQKESDVLTYSVVFEKLPPPNDARLSQVLVAGRQLEFFDKDRYQYRVYLPYTTTSVPQLVTETYQPTSTVAVTNAVSINPQDPEADRTSFLNVTSGDGTVTREYRIVFHQLPKLDLILAIGQSNMAGRAPFDAYTSQVDNVYLLTPGGELEIASNPMNKYANIRKDISLQKLGPAYSCAIHLQETLDKPLAFVVNAQGGSSITTWYEPGKSNYDATLTRALEAQRFGSYKAVIWHQGESDSGNSGSYLDRLSTLVSNLRRDLNEPELFFVAGELAYWRGGGTGSTAFNSMIQTISSRIPNSNWISAEGCTPLIDSSDPHFDAPSALLLGDRYAEKILETVYPTTRIADNQLSDPPVIQVIKDKLYFSTAGPLQFTLSDIMGRTHQTVSLDAGQSIELNMSKGLYLISFPYGSTNYTHKIFIN